jgi:tetratricopeptide (TPR) repeat protein
MKKSFGIDTRIRTEKGDYLIETYAAPHEAKVVSEVFFEGKIVEIKEVPYEMKISEAGIIKLIQKLQNSVISDLSNLFNLDEAMRRKATADGLYKIGRLFFKRKLIDRAKLSYEECIALDPYYADAYRDLSRIMTLDENFSAAEEFIVKGLRIRPERADYHFQLGRINYAQKKNAEAERQFSKALVLNSDYAEAYYYHAMVLLRELVSSNAATTDERVLTAKVDLKNASIIDDRFREKSFNEALMKLEQGAYREALAMFEDFSSKFMEIDVHDVIAEFSLFAKYSKRRISLLTVDEYISNILALMEEHPEYADLHNTLGKAYILKVRALLNAATLQFQKALEINPEYGEAKRNLELVVNEGKGILLLLRAILK